MNNITNLDLYNILKELGSFDNECELIKKLNEKNVVDSELAKKVKTFIKMLRAKRVKSKFSEKTLLVKEKKWLGIIFNKNSKSIAKQKNKIKPFENCSKRQKDRRANKLLHLSSNELIYTTQRKLRGEKKHDQARVIETLNTDSSLSVEKAKVNSLKTFTKEKALAIMVSSKLTKQEYINIRNASKDLGQNPYPSYKKNLQAKKDCYPEKDSIIVSETKSKIKWQSILNKTVERLLSNSRRFEYDYAQQMGM